MGDGGTFTLGALVQVNHGLREGLTILGRPVGKLMPEGRLKERETGSIIVIFGTDIPLSALPLRALAKCAAQGIGRGSPPGGNSSGDLFLAFSTANDGPMPHEAGVLMTRTELNGEYIDPVYLAAVEAVEEAVVNALVAGEDVETVKPLGMVCRGIDVGKLRGVFGGG